MSQSDPREEAVFEAAWPLEGAARVAYLDQACAGDAALRARVEGLLGALERAGSLLNQPAVTRLPATELVSASATAQPGDRIGRYKLLQQIGEGGCGVVYMAEQVEPVRRRVALKVLKLGMDTKQVIARFEAERQALALMDHPHIAKVLDAGATDTGRPFFVMELVRGIKITEFCDENHLPMRERLELFIQVCQAVQHAHQKGIIHRDLKPSNILVTVNDGVPVPKVIDFGIAKATSGQQLTDKTLFTAFEQFIGTPAYMSPEQAVMTSVDIDTRSDIYSLGVLLYELLTGQTPFDTKELLQAGFDEMRRTIREKEPARPSTRLTMELARLGSARVSRAESGVAPDSCCSNSKARGGSPSDVGFGGTPQPARETRALPEQIRTLIHALRGDLDWIVMKCLEKDRSRRYETANGLAADLRRHLNNEPVVARPPSKLYEFQKTVRRHKFGFAAVGAVVAALVIGLTVSLWQYRERGEAYRRAVKAEQEQSSLRVQAEKATRTEAKLRTDAEALQTTTRQNLYAADIYLAQHALEDGNYGLAVRALDAHRPRGGEQDVRGWEWRYLWQVCQGESLQMWRGHSNIVSALAISPDGKTLASASRDETVKLWEADTGRWIRTLTNLQGDLNSVAFSHDGKFLAVGSDGGAATLWDLASGRVSATFTGSWPRVVFSSAAPLLAIAFGGDVTGSRRTASVSVWDYAHGKVIQTFTNTGSRAAFAADGETIAIGSFQRSIRLWNIRTGRAGMVLTNSGAVLSLAFSPDNQTLVASSWGGLVNAWDVRTGCQLAPLTGHSARVWSVAFSPDGRTLATASSDQTIGLWDVPELKLKRKLKGHRSEVWSVAFLNDRKSLVTGSKDETLRRWRCDGEEETVPILPTNSVWRPAFSADGSQVAIGTMADEIRVWDVHTNRLRATCRGASRPVEFRSDWIWFQPDAQEIITVASNATLKIWHLPTQSLRTNVVLSTMTDRWIGARMAPRGNLFVALTVKRELLFWEIPSGNLQCRVPVIFSDDYLFDAKFSPDARWLVIDGADTTARVVDVSERRVISTLEGHRDRVVGFGFSPDGRLLASASSDGTVKIWETATWKELGTLVGHKEGLQSVSFSRDGRTLASASGDQTLRLWHLSTFRELAKLRLEHGLDFVSFAADDRTLAVFGGSRPWVQLWHAPTFSETDGDFNPQRGQ